MNEGDGPEHHDDAHPDHGHVLHEIGRGVERVVGFVLAPDSGSHQSVASAIHLAFAPPENTIVGTPHLDATFHHQQRGDFTCALVAQIGILQEYTGLNYEECKAAVEASQFHLIDTNGTTPENVGGWLQLHGIPCHTNSQANFGDLLRELASGHKVIVGVNAETLWSTHGAVQDFSEHAVDHAIWLTGVDFTDPDHPTVIINDSGEPNGAGRAYELNDFLDAADVPYSAGMFYVATDEPPPHLSEHLEGFDDHLGFVPSLMHFIDAHATQLALGGAALAVVGTPTTPARELPAISETRAPGLDLPEGRLQGAAARIPSFSDLSPADRDRLLDQL